MCKCADLLMCWCADGIEECANVLMCWWDDYAVCLLWIWKFFTTKEIKGGKMNTKGINVYCFMSFLNSIRLGDRIFRSAEYSLWNAFTQRIARKSKETQRIRKRKWMVYYILIAWLAFWILCDREIVFLQGKFLLEG
jgi:hypothetical protein